MRDIIDFYERHRNFLVSLAFLAFGVMLACYVVFYTGRLAWIDHADAAVNSVRVESIEVEKRLVTLKGLEAKTSSIEDSGIRSLPEFLKHINDIARETNVIIHKLTPAPNNKFRFTLQIFEEYLTFIRFSSVLEAHNVNIHDIEVHPYNMAKSPPVHAITFSLTPRDDAQPLANERLAQLTDRVNRQNKRNPFQRFVGDDKTKEVRPEIDLTWVYRLTGLGRIGGRRYATIDSQDFGEGDVFEGMAIARIETSVVYLEKNTPNGVEKYQLKFRRQRPGAADGKKGAPQPRK